MPRFLATVSVPLPTRRRVVGKGVTKGACARSPASGFVGPMGAIAIGVAGAVLLKGSSPLRDLPTRGSQP